MDTLLSRSSSSRTASSVEPRPFPIAGVSIINHSDHHQLFSVKSSYWKNLVAVSYVASSLVAGALVTWRFDRPFGVGILIAMVGALLIAGHMERVRQRQLVRDKAELSYRDDLTGLPNRRLFLRELRDCLDKPLQNGQYTAVFYIDIDHFKGINDALGHTIGDLFLQEVGSRLADCVGARGVLARFGGDEFTYLLNDVKDRQEVIQVAMSIMERFGKELDIQGNKIWASASTGIAMVGMPRPRPDDLLSMADAALYNAKAQGRSQYVLFEPNLPRPTARSVSLDTDIRTALARDQMVLHFQPIVRLSSMEMVGVEALIRWNHPLHGLLSPSEFIDLAEETGMIKPLGAWVIETASKQVSCLQGLYDGSLIMSVNLSALQFRHKGLLTEIASVSNKCGLNPGSLQLEITESALLHDDGYTLQTLADLRRAGFTIAIDDFGIGYSSLSYLRSFEVDALKLDQSFLNTLGHRSEAIVTGIIQLGHSLEMKIIAEGIENREQLDFLRSADCDEGQGYLLGRPMDEKELAAQLTTHGTRITLPCAPRGEAAANQRHPGTRNQWLPRPTLSR